MEKVILTTPDELEDLILRCLQKIDTAAIPEKEKVVDNSEKYIYSIVGLAKFMGCSKVTAQKFKNSGKVKCYQVGRKIMFKESEVLAAIQKPYKLKIR